MSRGCVSVIILTRRREDHVFPIMCARRTGVLARRWNERNARARDETPSRDHLRLELS